MSAQPAARMMDFHRCPAHDGGGVEGGARGVWINGQLAGRAGDGAACKGPRDFVVTGSDTVRINGRPAGRIASKTLHGGDVAAGSGTVDIGGPSAGTTLGSPHAGEAQCHLAAQGRNPPPGTVYPEGHPRAGQPVRAKGTQQSYTNCGIESCRIMVRKATGRELSEDQMLDYALEKGYAGGKGDPTHRYRAGGSYPDDRQELLRDHGVESEVTDQDMGTIGQAVAEGKGVITSHDAGILWNDAAHLGTGHAVIVTGLTYDAEGKLVTVTVLDTGTGNCMSEIPAPRFQRSLGGSASNKANITKEPIWT